MTNQESLKAHLTPQQQAMLNKQHQHSGHSSFSYYEDDKKNLSKPTMTYQENLKPQMTSNQPAILSKQHEHGGSSSFSYYEDDKKMSSKPTMTYQESLKPQLTPQQQAVLNKQYQQGGTINIFGLSSDDQASQQQRQPKYHQNSQKQHEQEPVVNRNRTQRIGFNPITGENYGSENIQQNPVRHQQYHDEPAYHTSNISMQPISEKPSLW